MLVRLTGLLIDVAEDRVVIDRDGLAYELLTPGYALADLAARRGQTVTLHTLHYLEGSLGGGNLVPRLVGFLSPHERDFFEHFTTVKGLGVKRGLKALVEPVERVARDIEAGDTKALSRLPGIGPRGAQQIVAELRGKLTAFARSAAGGGAAVAAESALSRAQRDALELLVAWGDHRGDAQAWLARAAELHADLAAEQTVEAWVKAAYRVKAGAEA